MASSYPNPFFYRIQSGSDIIWIRMRIRIKYYDEKQFINQSHKAAIQHEIIIINPPLQFKSSQKLIQVLRLDLRV